LEVAERYIFLNSSYLSIRAVPYSTTWRDGRSALSGKAFGIKPQLGLAQKSAFCTKKHRYSHRPPLAKPGKL
jgi:hypothetical protein